MRATPAKSESLLGLAPDGACRAALVTKCAVSSYLAVSPLPTLQQAVCFLLRYPSHYCAWTLSSILLYGARTFLWHCCRRSSATQNEFRKMKRKWNIENKKNLPFLFSILSPCDFLEFYFFLVCLPP